MEPQVLGQDYCTGPNIHSILDMQNLRDADLQHVPVSSGARLIPEPKALGPGHKAALARKGVGGPRVRGRWEIHGKGSRPGRSPKETPKQAAAAAGLAGSGRQGSDAQPEVLRRTPQGGAGRQRRDLLNMAPNRRA